MGGEAETFWLTRALFQRSMGLLYLVAFLVALNQFCPLLGERGLLPVPQFLRYVKFSQAPSLFFLHGFNNEVQHLKGLRVSALGYADETQNIHPSQCA